MDDFADFEAELEEWLDTDDTTPPMATPNTMNVDTANKPPVTTSDIEMRGQKRRRTQPKGWTMDEQRRFVIGLKTYGFGNWKTISEKLLPTRSPTQLASKWQKFKLRNDPARHKKRKSINDVKPIGEIKVMNTNTITACSSQEGSSAVTTTSETPIDSSSWFEFEHRASEESIQQQCSCGISLDETEFTREYTEELLQMLGNRLEESCPQTPYTNNEATDAIPLASYKPLFQAYVNNLTNSSSNTYSHRY